MVKCNVLLMSSFFGSGYSSTWGVANHNLQRFRRSSSLPSFLPCSSEMLLPLWRIYSWERTTPTLAGRRRRSLIMSVGSGRSASLISALGAFQALRYPKLTANLLAFEDGSRLLAWYRSLVQGLMEVGIELLPLGVERDDSMPLEDFFNLLLGQSDALVQAEQILVGVGVQPVLGDRVEGERDDVDGRDEVLGEGSEGKVFGQLLLPD